MKAVENSEKKTSLEFQNRLRWEDIWKENVSGKFGEYDAWSELLIARVVCE